nr:isoform 2 of ap-3 complex subunit mu-1 [Quercus suber]
MEPGSISALYIFDEHKYVSTSPALLQLSGIDAAFSSLILDHVYYGQPPTPSAALQLYLQHTSPRPSLMYLASTSPPGLMHSMTQDNLLFFTFCLSDAEPLLILELLHRVADALQEFLGSPLLATKISANYDIVAQIVAEIADAGTICRTDANALRDVVETGPGVLKHLLGGVGLPGSNPAFIGGSAAGPQQLMLQPAQTMQGSAIPWRRSNVRHTSNELYVDIVETLSVILAPSGRPLSAFAHGSIAFTSKVSGIPDLLLSLSTGGKGAGMGNRGDQLRAVMERAVFHPCVRLNRWKTDGILSFVPPDGQFALCGYETDLLGPDVQSPTPKTAVDSLNLPAVVELSTGLGRNGTDFEVRILQSITRKSAAAASLQSNLNGARSGSGLRGGLTAGSKTSALENLSVSIPLASKIRNVSDLHANKGDAQWLAAESRVEWIVSAKDLATGHHILRCTVQSPSSDTDDFQEHADGMMATTYDYDDDLATGHEGRNDLHSRNENSRPQQGQVHSLMPTFATLSYSVKGAVPSGLRVESLVIDTKKSKGLGDGIKPYKGVKYLTVSTGGIEARC